jgi:hypothetical protein
VTTPPLEPISDLWLWLAILILWLCVVVLGVAVLHLYKERALSRLDPDGTARTALAETEAKLEGDTK